MALLAYLLQNQKTKVKIYCVPGYYGLQCSKSCVAPFYGVGCQKLCSGCPISLCDVSYGCPRITEARISTTSLLYITTTIENIKSSLVGETTVTKTESSSIASKSSTTILLTLNSKHKYGKIDYCCDNYYFDSIKKDCLECPNGSHGRNCSKTCVIPKYGWLCYETCECKNDEYCDIVSGCLNDCVPAYYGLQCSKSCVAPFYGCSCPEARISTTSFLYVSTTIENIKSSLVGETTVTKTESSSIASKSSTTVNRKPTSSIKEL
uniref:Multiple epidermal growth factor-like domains 6 n=1 Tax=Magallana gigas TaxID=29159 RepID=K1PIG9_MAGGI